GRLAAAFGKREAGFALEADNENIVLYDQRLLQTEIAVNADGRPVDFGRQQIAQPRAERITLCQELVEQRPVGFAHGVTLAQRLEQAVSAGDGVTGPAPHILRYDLFRREFGEFCMSR